MPPGVEITSNPTSSVQSDTDDGLSDSSKSESPLQESTNDDLEDLIGSAQAMSEFLAGRPTANLDEGRKDGLSIRLIQINFDEGVNKIQAIFNSIQGMQKPSEKKALFVIGHTAAGKTTFIKNLFNSEFEKRIKLKGDFFYISPSLFGSQDEQKNLHRYACETAKNFGMNAVLEAVTVSVDEVASWKNVGYDVTVVFVEASFPTMITLTSNRANFVMTKFEKKAEHAATRLSVHDRDRDRINVPELVAARNSAARLVLNNFDVEVSIFSGNETKGDRGFRHYNMIERTNIFTFPDNFLENKTGYDASQESKGNYKHIFLLSDETPDSEWYTENLYKYLGQRRN